MRTSWLLAPLLAGCTVTQPFQGPLYTLEQGLTDPDHDEYLVAVTYIHVSGPGSELFDAHVDAIEDALADQPGLVGYALRAAIPGRDRWTMSVWTDEESLLGFVTSDVHLAAMADLGQVAEEADHTHFTAARSEIPVPWDRALAALDEGAP